MIGISAFMDAQHQEAGKERMTPSGRWHGALAVWTYTS